MRSCLCGRLTPGYLLERLGCITHTTATLHPPGRAAHSRDKVAGAPGAPPTGAPPTGAPPRVQPGRRGAAVGRALARDGDRRGRRGAALRAARGLPARGRAARGRAPRGGRGLPEADVLGLPRAPCGGEPPRCSSSGPCAALEACVLRRLRASLQAPTTCPRRSACAPAPSARHMHTCPAGPNGDQPHCISRMRDRVCLS